MAEKVKKKAKGLFVLGVIMIVLAIVGFVFVIGLNAEKASNKKKLDKSVLGVLKTSDGELLTSDDDIDDYYSDAITGSTVFTVVTAAAGIGFIVLYKKKNKNAG